MMRWILLIILLTSCQKMSLRQFHTMNRAQAVSGWLEPSADGTTGNTVVFRGDSITWGIGGNSLPGGLFDGWTKKLCTLKGWTESNVNMSGFVISNPGACSARPQWNITDATAGIPAKTASLRYLFIAFGVNDHFLANSNVTPSQYQTATEAAVDYALSQGWQNRRIIILPIYWTNFDNSAASNYCSPGVITDATRKAAFIAAAQAAASSRGCNYFNVYQHMADNGGDALLADGIHPNDSGHTTIANGANIYIP